MADGFIQVPDDSTGKKLQTFVSTQDGNTVHAEALALVDNSGTYISTLPVSLAADARSANGFNFVTTIAGKISVYNPIPADLFATVSGTVAATQSGDWTVKSANASNFLTTVAGTVTATQSNASNFLATIAGTVTAVQSNASNFLSTVSGTVAATQSGTWNIGAISSNVNIADAGGSITVDGTVGVTANTAFNLSQVVGTTVDVNSGTKSAGTQRVVLATDQPALTNKLLVTPDANSSFNLSQIVGTTVDANSGTKSAGTQRVVLATDQPQLTNKLLVTPDANSSFNLTQISGTVVDGNSGNKSAGTLRVVLATDQPALTNKLLVTPDSNIAFDLARIQGQASVASVTGVLDVMPRKRTASTGLSPLYVSGRINTSTTTTLVAATCYLSVLHMTCTNQGTTWAMKVQDGQATPRGIVPNFVLNANFISTNPISLSYDEPILCTTGINVVTVGATTGNVDYYATYWQ